jgi:hypothetical protein
MDFFDKPCENEKFLTLQGEKNMAFGGGLKRG